jgi:hypothetical protein
VYFLGRKGGKTGGSGWNSSRVVDAAGPLSLIETVWSYEFLSSPKKQAVP